MYAKEPSRLDVSFEHPTYMFKVVGKKLITKMYNYRLKMFTYSGLCSQLAHLNIAGTYFAFLGISTFMCRLN